MRAITAIALCFMAGSIFAAEHNFHIGKQNSRQQQHQVQVFVRVASGHAANDAAQKLDQNQPQFKPLQQAILQGSHPQQQTDICIEADHQIILQSQPHQQSQNMQVQIQQELQYGPRCQQGQMRNQVNTQAKWSTNSQQASLKVQPNIRDQSSPMSQAIKAIQNQLGTSQSNPSLSLSEKFSSAAGKLMSCPNNPEPERDFEYEEDEYYPSPDTQCYENEMNKKFAFRDDVQMYVYCSPWDCIWHLQECPELQAFNYALERCQEFE